MSPVNTSSYGPGGRGFHGVVTVGQRGQVAIPAKARRDLRIEAGAQLVVLTDPNEGIALIPLELLLSKQDNPVAKLVRSMLPGVMPPDGENADDNAGEHPGDVAGKVADDGGDSR
ncbi:AbrB family toxin-antitoxin system antitoxin [Peptidiphaga gingivicola]|uniref:AbrB family toxin-antitoxin system antitoxin n=1 Tax=Peptidiphaga gingivicola TaxID=2741497 RepID=A0A179B6D7_9ACTO|nr:AbrB/MazE/SpoVT family DNA-binding domain-containing protein [Peptidiphaga gingivicola]OAP86813.1 AbrB family toxin-antitoxin system antitoxin [Peptidiphaga gingivicola]